MRSHRAMARSPPGIPAPDGGWGLVVAAAAHIVYFLVIGMFRCFGVLYLSWMHEFQASALQTGAIGSITASCSFFGSPLAAIACDHLGCRSTGIISGIVTVVGMVGSALAQNIYEMYVTCAITGLGIACAIMAANVVIIEYFKKYFAVANGFTSSGVGTGMIAQPLLIQLLLDHYGWRGAMLILAGLSGNVCVAGALYRPLRMRRSRRTRRPRPLAGGSPSRLQADDLQFTASSSLQREVDDGDEVKTDIASSSEQGPWSDHQYAPRAERGRRSPLVSLSKLPATLGLKLFRNKYRFTLFCLIQLQFNMSYVGYIVYIVPRAESLDVGGTFAATLVSVVGFGSLVGRLGSGILINCKLKAEVVFACSTFVCFVGVLSAQFDNYAAFLASSALVGLGSGIVKSAHNVLVRDFVGASNFGRGLGIADVFRGIGDLVGPIVAGRLFDVTGSYVTMFYVLAALFFGVVIQVALAMPILRRLEPDSSAPEQLTPE